MHFTKDDGSDAYITMSPAKAQNLAARLDSLVATTDPQENGND
jgi:hypothetical protein